MASEEENNAMKERVFSLITNYPFSCDLILSFFNASVFSDRFDSPTDPFPPRFINHNNEKDINLLRKLLDHMPPLSLAENMLLHRNDLHYINVLDWLYSVVDPKILEVTETPQMDLRIDKQPNVVFGVRRTEEEEEVWNQKKNERNVIYAFYGTSLENMYSIVSHGLDSIFSTTTQPSYGDGLYMTNQMDSSSLFSRFGEGWKFSMLGERLRVLALCEIIDDPSKIERLKQKWGEKNPNGIYIIVKDKSFARVKYFFVYTKSGPVKSYFASKVSIAICYLLAIAILLYSIYANRQALMDNFLPSFLK